MAGSRVSLAYVEMALSITISFFAGKVCEKHGFGKRRGWIFLLLLSAIDLAVATGQLVMNGGNTGAQQILDAIKFSVDFPVILIAIISVLQRVNDAIGSKVVSPRLVISLTMALLTGLILAMIGGISFAMHEASIKLDTARGLNYAAAIIHAVAFVWTASIAVRTVLRIGAMEKGETILAKAALLSVLLLLVHLIYLMLAIFDANPARFNTLSGDVGVRASMTTAEDFIVASMLLYAGLRARKGNDAHTGVPIEGFVPPGEGENDHELDDRGAENPPQELDPIPEEQ